MNFLDDLCEFIVDCEHKTAPIQEEGIPSIRTPNIGRGYFILDDVNRVSEATYDSWTRRAVPEAGDLILAREAPVGNVAVIPTGLKCCLGQRTVLMRPKEKEVDSDYLCYLLLTPALQADLLGKSGGATVHHLNLKDIRALPIPQLPTLDDQKAKASIIRAYNDLIETNRRRTALLEESARLLYREWFVNLRFPEHQELRVNDGPPRAWQIKKLGDVVEAIGGATPSTTRPDYWDGDIVWLTPTDVTRNDCLYLADSGRKITATGYESCSAKVLPPGTIFMTSRASIGFFALLDQPACTNQGFIAVIPKVENSRNYFLFHLMSRVEEFETKATGTTFKELSKKAFKELSVLVPAQEILVAFEQLVEPIIEQIFALKKQNILLTEARDALLPKLMSGEIHV